jgi:hypothetical protein
MRPRLREVGRRAAGHRVGSAVQSGCGELHRGLAGRCREIDQLALHCGMDSQDGAEQGAVPAADVDDGAEAAPVEAPGDLRGVLSEAVGHLGVEGALQGGRGVKISPEVLAIAAGVAGLSGCNCVQEFGECQLCSSDG